MIEARSISAGFNGVNVIHDISLHVTEPSMTGIIGPNGSGKSTLLKSLAGVHPHEGEVLYDGTPAPTLTRRERVRRLSYVAQTSGPPVALTVREVVELGRTAGRGLFASAGPEDEGIVDKALAHADLHPVAHKKLNELSGGQVQRAMVARAMAQQSANMLLDEPTNHLDPRHQYNLMEMLSHLSREHDAAVVLAIHNLELAARYCDRLVVLDRGRIVADGTPADVLTPELLADVFGVHGRLAKTTDGIDVLAVSGPVEMEGLRT